MISLYHKLLTLYNSNRTTNSTNSLHKNETTYNIVTKKGDRKFFEGLGISRTPTHRFYVTLMNIRVATGTRYQIKSTSQNAISFQQRRCVTTSRHNFRRGKPNTVDPSVLLYQPINTLYFQDGPAVYRPVVILNVYVVA